MRPSTATLALRDPALAALVGGIPGADFGAEGADFGAEGADFGVEFGDEPTASAMQQVWQEKMNTKRRENVLEPNRDSSVKIERYTFGIGQTVTLSTAVALSMTGNPETTIRPQRITTNAPAPAFARLASIKVANVGVIVGGEVDAFDFSASADDASLDVPTINPQNQVKATGNYDGLLPLGGYVTATPFRFIVSFKGPAKMTA